MKMLARALAIVAIVTVAAHPLAAQRIDRVPGRAGAAVQDRDGLERQFRERLADVVRRRLNLDASQMRQLGTVNDRYERERMMLLREERQMRQALRAEVLAGDSADQPRVSELLDRALRIQRRRLDVTEREQRDLAAFMTPVQRAKYVALQDDMRRRIEEMRQQRQQRRPGAPALGGRRPPPP